MSISLDFLFDNFSPAHMFEITSIVFSTQSKTEATFYRLSGERCLPSGKKVFITSVHEGKPYYLAFKCEKRTNFEESLQRKKCLKLNNPKQN